MPMDADDLEVDDSLLNLLGGGQPFSFSQSSLSFTPRVYERVDSDGVILSQVSVPASVPDIPEPVQRAGGPVRGNRRGRGGSSAAGSTRDKRRRDYCFTANYDNREQGEDAIGRLKEDALVKYIVVGHENAPTTGQYHLQGYLYHFNPVSFNALKVRYPGWHFEACRGSADQNIAYCKKGGDFVEHGDPPKDNGGEKTKEKWTLARQLAKTGQLDEVDDQIFICHYSTLKRIGVDNMIKPPDLEAPCGIWYYGKAGTGKSYAAREEFSPFYPKLPNKWWCGYQNEDNVIIDDFGKVHEKLGYHLKIWADRYSFLGKLLGPNRWV